MKRSIERLIEDEGYLDNAAMLNNKNPAWQIYFDRTMEGYLFPILLKYEKDPQLKNSMKIWQKSGWTNKHRAKI